MRVDKIMAEGIAIPTEVIQRWRDRKIQLDQVIADAQRESALINRKLEAVAVLASEEGDSSNFHLTAPEPAASPPSIISEIARVVTDAKAMMQPKEIREHLRRRDGVPAFSDNYFYTALKRAADKNLIRKAGDLYGPLQQSSPKGENPEA